jgi:exonuclease VII large subunit
LEIDEVNNFLSSIAEAPDVAQADKLRSEMQAYLTRVDRYMGRSSRKLSKYSNGFDEQSRSQFDQLARERIAKVQSEIDESVAELTTPEAGSDETASEKLGRKKAEKQRRSYEESPTELYEPEEGREEA